MSVQIDDELEYPIRGLAELGRTMPDQVVRDALSDYANRLDARQSFHRESDASW